MKRSRYIDGKKPGILFFLFLIAALFPLGCAPSIIPSLPASATATETSHIAPVAEPTLTSTLESKRPTATTEVATTASLPPSPVVTSTELGPGESLLFVADADARVRQSNPNTNYGDDTTLHADDSAGSRIESFMRFNVTGVTRSIQSARLRVYVTENGTQDGPAVYATSNDWEESDITWRNRPERIGTVVDNKARLSPNNWVEYDATFLVTGVGTFNFVLIADSSDGVVFSSREGDQPPQLVLTLGNDSNTSTAIPTATATGSSDDIVLVGAGDISECDNDNDELTAQLLDSIPGTVFTTGDNAYDNGTIDEYNTCYGPTWGRHKDRTKPVPGNHEYNTEGAAGYFQYFNNIPSYYAYTLGSWRIYALNSEIDISENSPQVTWLQTDLAANPNQCVLAYWHQPRWTSGSRHGSDDDLQTLWQIFYEAGAELIINGHEHHYERFAEMNAQGAAVSPGLREIVVGTGGNNLYDFDSPLPASEVRNDTSYGVLKVTLRAGGYDWQFIPIAGSTFTDSGSSNCH